MEDYTAEMIRDMAFSLSLTGILKEDDLDARKAKRLKEKYETA